MHFKAPDPPRVSGNAHSRTELQASYGKGAGQLSDFQSLARAVPVGTTNEGPLA